MAGLSDTLDPGTYLAAISGGVDSMVLLDLLQKQPGLSIVVAHFDHGMRTESSEDARFVEEYCRQRGLPFRLGKAELGPDASEAEARDVRYAFLQMARKESDARAIVTAHHADDALETAVINMLRGTSARGLQALDSHECIVRPLLGASKREIKKYAHEHGIDWREDATNTDTRYLRNYVRKNIIPKLDRKKLQEVISKQRSLTEQTDSLLYDLQEDVFHGNELDRQLFVALPHAVSLALIRNYLDSIGLPPAKSRTLESIVHFCKTAASGKAWHVHKNLSLKATDDTVVFVRKKI